MNTIIISTSLTLKEKKVGDRFTFYGVGITVSDSGDDSPKPLRTTKPAPPPAGGQTSVPDEDVDDLMNDAPGG